MTPRNLDTIFDLNPKERYHEEDNNEELVFYKAVNSPLMSILKISKQEDRSYVFNYCEMADSENEDEEVQSYNEMTLKPGQVRMIQVMCEFALPSLVGVHAV